MKKITLIFAMVMVTMSMWAQDAAKQDFIYTNDGKEIEAKVLEVSSSEIKYKDWNNQNGPVYILTVAEIKKISYANGTEKTFTAQSAPAQPQPTQAASSPKAGKGGFQVGFQFNIDVEGNLAFLSGSRIRNAAITPIDNDFAIGGANLTLGAGVRVAEWLFAGVSAGILGEWGSPKVKYTNKEGKTEEGKANYAAYTIPIYADVRTYAPTHGNCYPYAEVGVGGYVGVDGSVKFGGNKIEDLCGTPAGGFYFLTGVGLEFKCLNIGAGYKLMRNNNFTGNHGYVKLGISLGRPQKLRK